MTEDNTDLVTREKRRFELEQTEFSTGSQGGALMQPKNGKELMDMANMMSASGQMIRDFYRGNPGDCAALIMICQPYGFNPFMTSWKTYKASKNADAPVSFEGQLVNAMVNQSAPVKGRLKYSYDGEGPTRTCTVIGIDRETGDEIIYTTPELKSIPVKNSPLWKGDPDQQLGYYAARSWARRHFPELLLGVYTREEIQEAPIRDITPKGEESDLTKRLKAAQAEPEVIAEEIIPTSDDVEKVSTPAEESLPSRDINEDIEDAEVEVEFDEADVFPGSAEYNEGMAAAEEDVPIDLNPYDANPEYSNWLAGYKFTPDKKDTK